MLVQIITPLLVVVGVTLVLYIGSYYLIRPKLISGSLSREVEDFYRPLEFCDSWINYPSFAVSGFEGDWKEVGGKNATVSVDSDGTCCFSETTDIPELSGRAFETFHDRTNFRSFIIVDGRKYEVRNFLGLLCVADIESYGHPSYDDYISWRHWLIWDSDIPDSGFYLFYDK